MSLMAEQTDRTDLSDLVRRRRAELGLSGRDLRDRCIDPVTSEVPFSYPWLSKVERAIASVAPPKLPLLRALAAGLGLPLSIVRDAALAQYMGIELQDNAIWSADESTRVTVARMEELSPQGRAELAELVEFWTRSRRSIGQNPEDR